MPPLNFKLFALILPLVLSEKSYYCKSYLPSPYEILTIDEPRAYAFVNDCSKEITYEKYADKFRNDLKYESTRYKLIRFVDDGGSGNVYVGQDTLTGRRVLLKQLKKMSSGELKYNLNSVYFQQVLTNSVYIERPLDVIKHTNGRVTFVYRYEESTAFKLNRRILRQLLTALDYAHMRGIMHRDVKPANIIVYPKSNAHLIDWNLASLFYFSKENDVELGTIIYEAPEMLLNYPYYHYSIDLWGIGVTMLEYYYDFRFRGDTREEVLDSVVRLFGGDVLQNFVEKYKLKADGCLKKLLKKSYPKRGLRSMRPVRHVPKHAFNLMQKLLTFDHNDRLLAKQALQHPYFTGKKSLAYRKSTNQRI